MLACTLLFWLYFRVHGHLTALDRDMGHLEAKWANRVPAVPPGLTQKLSRVDELEGILSRQEGRLQQLEGPIRHALSALAASPQIRLFGSGFDRFARLVVEEGARQAGGPDTRRLLEVLERAGFGLTRFKSSFKATVEQLGKTLPRAPESTRELYAQLFTIYKKTEGAHEALQALESLTLPTPTFADNADGLTFEEYCGRLLQDPSRLETLAQKTDGLFAHLVEDYSRVSARRLLEAVRAPAAQGNPGDLRRRLRDWLLSNLLPLDDYLLNLSREVESRAGRERPLQAAVAEIQGSLEALLQGLSIRRVSVRVNEDYFEPEDHELLKRVSPGQLIRKIERHGFAWDGTVLRKAGVWVG
ncbi:MAG: hypothetical protein HY319_31225 [Armatimonadetes bacterium]|nr:hypothetical protein [Armatimonadota bacterium]